MWKDPIVEEVRRHREAHAAKFDYDMDAICRDLQQQDASGRKTVSFPAKRIPRAHTPEADVEQASTTAR